MAIVAAEPSSLTHIAPLMACILTNLVCSFVGGILAAVKPVDVFGVSLSCAKCLYSKPIVLSASSMFLGLFDYSIVKAG